MSTSLFRPCLCIVAGLALSAGLFAQAPKLVFPDASPTSTLKQRVGLTDIEITYSRPGIKGREIFGNLVPYDQVWRTGANTATKITFSTDVKLNGTAIPAGTYELFTIPGKTEWTVIIHKNMSQWGAYTYDAKNDVARVTARPFPLPLPLENFTINFNHMHDESALLEFAWDRTLVPVKVEVDVTTTLVPQIEAVMASAEPKKPYVPAAMFYLDHNLDLKKAAGWMDAAIAAQPDAFYFIYRKALIQEKMGDKDGAIATAKASIEGANKAGGAVKDEYVHLNEALIARVNGTTPAPAAPAAPAKPHVNSSGGTSPHETISAVIGDRHAGNRITLTYGRPFTKDPKTGEPRKIWGGLVKWGEAYRLGADEATVLLTPRALLVGGTTIPAGAYTLYLVPSETGASKLAFSSTVGKWGDPVDETHDLARIDLTKEPLEKAVDQLTIALANDSATGAGTVKIMWENTQFSLPFTVKQ
jgi:hypothetical protein